MINSVLKLPHSKFRFNWTNISSFVPEFLRWGGVPRSQSPITSACFFCFFSPASLLFLSSTILWMAEAAGGEKTTEGRRNERLCPRCPWLSAVFCQQSLSWQLYGKRSGNLFNVFLYQKIIGSDEGLLPNQHKDYLNQQSPSSDYTHTKGLQHHWYQKIDFSIFWYQKIFFDIKISIFLYQKLIFLISDHVIWCEI